MNPELDRKLRYLRLSGMVTTLPARNAASAAGGAALVSGISSARLTIEAS